MRAGAAGFLVKDIVPEDLLHAALLARGLSTAEIADRLVISPLTAKTHINRAMTKLHARDRAQLVILADESGLVAPGGG
ncbi:regulatory protein, luxR family [Micromonospora matsumotoense]|uniref:Regulatory protein, luxR family n=1 Tax=Micromonospora matsumotoense TaxID=121616 RepID=A0A1C4Z0T5_9ACTN|nr:regulatory protein, luxR family [Micromonospora matsumotoense]